MYSVFRCDKISLHALRHIGTNSIKLFYILCSFIFKHCKPTRHALFRIPSYVLLHSIVVKIQRSETNLIFGNLVLVLFFDSYNTLKKGKVVIYSLLFIYY